MKYILIAVFISGLILTANFYYVYSTVNGIHEKREQLDHDVREYLQTPKELV